MEKFKLVDPSSTTVDDEILNVAERQNPDGTTDVMCLIHDQDGIYIQTEFESGSGNQLIPFPNIQSATEYFRSQLG
jgi:hypothetical protein